MNSEAKQTLLNLMDDLETGGHTSSNLSYTRFAKTLFFKRLKSGANASTAYISYAIGIAEGELINFAIQHDKLRSLQLILDLLDIPRNNMDVRQRVTYYYLLQNSK